MRGSRLLPKEVCIVDNSGALTSLPKTFPVPIRVIRPPYNLGVAESWNVIGKTYRPHDIVISNDDIQITPHAFETILAKKQLIVLGCHCSFFLIREGAWQQVGEFDRSFWPAYAEDRDYRIRADIAGVEFGRTSTIVRHAGSATGKVAFSRFFFRRNVSWCLRKWGMASRKSRPTYKQPWNGKHVDTLEDEYERRCHTKSDVAEHLPVLRKLAENCDHVTTFGLARGNAGFAFLAAQPRRLLAYEPELWPGVDMLHHFGGRTSVELIEDDPTNISIEPTDLLFLDSLEHTYEQARQELRHHYRVRKYLVFHDTVTFGNRGSRPGTRGIAPAIQEFLKGHPAWRVYEDRKNCHGLLILARKCKMTMDEASSIKITDRPFLSIVTRHMVGQRTRSLQRLKETIARLTDDDYEHVILPDTELKGVVHANKLFFKHRHRVAGKYVFMLDDDDVLVCTDLVETVKSVAAKYDPDVIFLKGRIDGRGMFPKVWGHPEQLRLGQIGTINFCVKFPVWWDHINAFGAGDAGDYRFISDILKSCKTYTYLWLKKEVAMAPNKGRGKAESAGDDRSSQITNKLEIGPGSRRLGSDWVTLDRMSRKGVDIVCLWGEEPLPFPDEHFKVVYASHVLEHVAWYNSVRALKEVHRVLEHNGVVEIWVPDFGALVERWKQGTILEDGWLRRNPHRHPFVALLGRLYFGDGSYGEASWHRAAFTEDYLAQCLVWAGFSSVHKLDKPRGVDHGVINLGMSGVK